MDEAHLGLRDFDPDRDSPFLYSTWRNALYYSPLEPIQDADRFFSEETKRIRKIIKDGAVIKIACLDETPDQIVGYSVINQNSLEFVYVKRDYRRIGVAKLLLEDGFKEVTNCLTKLGRDLAIKKKLKIKGEENGREKESASIPGEAD
jgi:hypothetical protein